MDGDNKILRLSLFGIIGLCAVPQTNRYGQEKGIHTLSRMYSLPSEIPGPGEGDEN